VGQEAPQDLIAVALGLGAALSWGVADFLGGLKSRRLDLLAVLLLSQAAGLALITAIVAARGEGPPAGEYLGFAVLSGLAGACGLAAFYRGLAVGAMAIVTPISATAAAIPVTVGLATGDRPSSLQAAGMAVAVVGVVLASRERGDAAVRARVAAGAGLALVAAAGFGCFFLAIDRASDGDVFWAILGNRLTSVTVLAVAALALRPRLAVGGGHGAALLAVGLLDITANSLFALAATEGLVSLVSVLASLYPVVVVMLARLFLGERVHALQQAGAAGALAGVLLISAG
jgi:drug/metabolite transporter (DMT)-like permease